MLELSEALAHVQAHAAPRAPRAFDVAQACGLALAEAVSSDLDSPPYDKSIVDGFALRFADLSGGKAELTVVDRVMAGDVPRHAIEAGQAAQIMTGAPVPPGADTVVMVERTQPRGEGQRVAIDDPALTAGRNILRRGAAFRAGDTVLSPGTVLGAAQIGLLCEVGRTHVRAVPRCRAAVLSTGNELVPHTAAPSTGQIRNSNGPMLAAQLRGFGAEVEELGIARDQRPALEQAIARGLESDVLVLSGGVSAGVLDLVPSVLESLGVREVFHKVRLKPGKPTWFGMHTRGNQAGLVFGLPGNPVSAFVCAFLFVRPAVAALAGRGFTALTPIVAELAAVFSHRGGRPTFHPAKVFAAADGRARAEPLRWQGSADLRGLAQADALVYFPAGDRDYAVGESVEIFLL